MSHLLSTLILLTMTSSKAALIKCRAKYELSQCYSYDGMDQGNGTCSQAEVCQKTFNISSINMQPYNIRLLQRLLAICCGSCIKTKEVNMLKNIAEFTPENINESHFVFPVMGPANKNRLHGHYFIPFVDPPNLYYITEKDDDVITKLMVSCLQIWPVILVVLFLVSISGFVCWLIETWSNKEQFRRPFLTGWFDGIWWSFVSITTVGYGDKVPKSVFARLFAVLCIVLGISIFSVFIAMLSAKITIANYPLPPDLEGAKVGAMRHRTYDASLVARNGGVLVDVEAENNTRSILQLIRLLRKKEIDGFILDRYTFVLFRTFADQDLTKDAAFMDDINYLKYKTFHTEKYYRGDKLSLGILVKDVEDYEFFSDFVIDNAAVINTCSGLLINYITQHKDVKVKGVVDDALLSAIADFIWPALIYTSIALALICCFGFAYEVFRRSTKVYKQRMLLSDRKKY